MKFFISRLLFITITSLFVVTGWMLFFEDQYIYYPDKEIYHTPKTVGLEFQDIHLISEDGILLHAWMIPHPKPRFTLLHFHGNAGNISHRLHLYEKWHQMGFSVFAVEYRGYGNSQGSPSEEGFYRDANAAWNELVKKQHIPASKIIIAGRSLGCAVATKLATETQPASLILETPFTNISDMATEHYPWVFPVRYLARTKFDTLALIKRVQVPVMVISAENDQIVPAFMAQEIYSAANKPKHAITLSGDHNDFDLSSSSQYNSVWHAWLNRLEQ